MRTTRTFLLSIVCLSLAVAGCGSTDIGDILGGGGSPSQAGDVRGTVERVDTGSRIIWLEAEDYRSELRNEADQVALYYDDQTRVEFEGRTYEPGDLERGDRIAADVERNGSRLVANQIEVLSDISRGSGTGSSTGSSYADLRGIVRYVDTGDRTIELENVDVERSFESDVRSGRVVVHYDADTVVRFEGRNYEPENLERGDEVEVEVRDLGSRLLAEQIEVVRDARASSRF
ncbi:MAG TPA: DUF5666 domain-containing protein [Thermoanaerobaculia bacterium]|nr:DUF5666 domain-containing protein [Thermoanaerobaculia bacterium]